jgi:hypothetical protein
MVSPDVLAVHRNSDKKFAGKLQAKIEVINPETGVNRPLGGRNLKDYRHTRDQASV